MNDTLMQLLMNRGQGGNTGVSGGGAAPQMGLSPEPSPQAQAIGMGAMGAASGMSGAPMGGPAPNRGFNAGGLMGIAQTALHGGAPSAPQMNGGAFGGMLAKLMPMLQARQQMGGQPTPQA